MGEAGGALGRRSAPLGFGDLGERVTVCVLNFGSGRFDVAGVANVSHNAVQVVAQVGETLWQFGKSLVEGGASQRYRCRGCLTVQGCDGSLSCAARFPCVRAVVHGAAGLVGLFAVAGGSPGRGIGSSRPGASGVAAMVPLRLARRAVDLAHGLHRRSYVAHRQATQRNETKAT